MHPATFAAHPGIQPTYEELKRVTRCSTVYASNRIQPTYEELKLPGDEAP